MADDPVTWLTKHKRAGIDLREECWALRKTKDADAWHKRELLWAKELWQGIAARSPRDVQRVEVLNEIPLCALPHGHPWYGEHLNPLDFHAQRLVEVGLIEAECREAFPTKPKLKKTDGVDPAEFFAWFSEYAAKAATNDQRIPREQNKSDAESHFECSIPGDWITEGRGKLPTDHPFRRKGRPSSTQ